MRPRAALSSCSCTSCCLSERESPCSKRFKGVTNIDRLFYDEYVSLRERKLVEKLIKARALYDNLRSQILSQSSLSAEGNVRLRKRIKFNDVRIGDLFQILHLVDKGDGSSKFSDCCSYCSCGSESQLCWKRHKDRKRVTRQGGGSHLCSQSEVTARRRAQENQQARCHGVQFKHTHSDPCTCTLKLISKQKVPTTSSREQDSLDKFGKEDIKLIRLYSDVEEGVIKSVKRIRHTSSKIKRQCQYIQTKSVEKFKQAKCKIKEKLDLMQTEYVKRRDVESVVRFDELGMQVQKDSLTKFREQVKRETLERESQCEAECSDKECVPEKLNLGCKRENRPVKTSLEIDIEEELKRTTTRTNAPQNTLINIEIGSKAASKLCTCTLSLRKKIKSSDNIKTFKSKSSTLFTSTTSAEKLKNVSRRNRKGDAKPRNKKRRSGTNTANQLAASGASRSVSMARKTTLALSRAERSAPNLCESLKQTSFTVDREMTNQSVLKAAKKRDRRSQPITGKPKHASAKRELRPCNCSIKLTPYQKGKCKGKEDKKPSYQTLLRRDTSASVHAIASSASSLLPYECAPGVCVPQQCNPFECLALIKKRYNNTRKHIRHQSSEKRFVMESKSSITPTPAPRRAKRVQSSLLTYTTEVQTQFNNSHRECSEETNRIQEISRLSGLPMVKISSSFNFNFEISKGMRPPVNEDSNGVDQSRKEPPAPRFESITNETVRLRKSILKTKKENGPRTVNKYTHVATKSRNIFNQSTRAETPLLPASVTKATGTSSSKIKRRDVAWPHYACEPYTCEPGLCDPHECLEIIKKQKMLFSRETAQQRSKTWSHTAQVKSLGRIPSQNQPTVAPHRETLRSALASSSRERKPARNAVKVGSALSFSIEFSKNRLPAPDSFEKPFKQKSVHFEINDDAQINTTEFEKHSNESRLNRKSVSFFENNNDFQLKTIKPEKRSKENKLKRCFCSFKLWNQKVFAMSKFVLDKNQTHLKKSIVHESIDLSQLSLVSSKHGFKYKEMRSYFNENKSLHITRSCHGRDGSVFDVLNDDDAKVITKKCHIFSETCLTMRNKADTAINFNKKLQNFKSFSSTCSRSDVTGIAPLLRRRFCAMNIGVQERRAGPRHKLKPYECEPGVCEPGACDPYECQKLIQKRLLKKSSKMSGTSAGSRSRSSATFRQKPHFRGTGLQAGSQGGYHSQKRAGKPQAGFYYTSTPNKSHKQAVRVGSTFSFSIEFSKEGLQPMQPSEEERVVDDARAPRMRSRNVRAMRPRRGRRTEATMYAPSTSDRRLQSELTRDMHSSTDRLSRRVKSRKTDKERRHHDRASSITMKGKKIRPSVSSYTYMKEKRMGPSMSSTGQNTRAVKPAQTRRVLGSNECEPGVCVPGQCDPYQCLERIKARHKHTRESAVGFGQPQTRSTSSITSKQRTRRRRRPSQSRFRETSSKSITSAGRNELPTASRREKEKEGKSINFKVERPSRQVVRISSSFSFNVEFFKDRTSPEVRLAETSFPVSKIHTSTKTVGYLRTNVPSHARGAQGRAVRRRDSQVTTVPRMQSTTTASMPKRCYCTGKLQGVKNVPTVTIRVKPPQRTESERIQTNKMNPRECPPGNCDPRPGECDPLACLRKMNIKNKLSGTDVAGSKLRAYVCPPGTCDPGPGECDPYACLRKINQKHKGSGTLTVRPKSSYSSVAPSKDRMVNTVQYSNVLKRPGDSQRQRRRPGYVQRPRETRSRRAHPAGKSETNAVSPISGESKRKQTVRVASTFSFNIEFYKEKPPGEEVIETNKKEAKEANERKLTHKSRYKSQRAGSTEQRRHRGAGATIRSFDRISQVSEIMPHRGVTTRSERTQGKSTEKLEKKSQFNAEKPERKRTPSEVTRGSMTRKAQKKKGIHYKLKPYECERGVCTPGECDPNECLLRIQRRGRRESATSTARGRGRSASNMASVGSGTSMARSVSTASGAPRRRPGELGRHSGSGTHGRRPPKTTESARITSRRAPAPSYRPMPQGQVVRIGSSYSFNIEFYKDRSYKDSNPRVKALRMQENKRDQGSGQDVEARSQGSQESRLITNRDSQAAQPKMRYSLTEGRLLKRCFCTLKLQKSYKKFNPPSNIRNQRVYMATTHTLGPYECEPGFCVPYQCDPVECAKRIRQRMKQSKICETQQPGVQSSYTDVGDALQQSKPVQGASWLRALGTPSRKLTKLTRGFMNGEYQNGSEKSNRQTVKISSSFNFNVEFFKDKPASGGSQYEQILDPYTGLPLRRKDYKGRHQYSQYGDRGRDQYSQYADRGRHMYSQYGDKGLQFGDKCSQYGDNGSLYGDKGSQYADRGRHMYSQYGGRGLQFGDKCSQYADKGRPMYSQYDDKGAQYGGKGALYGDKGAKYGDKGAQYGGKDAQYGDKSAQYGDKGAQYGDRGAQYGERGRRTYSPFGEKGSQYGGERGRHMQSQYDVPGGQDECSQACLASRQSRGVSSTQKSCFCTLKLQKLGKSDRDNRGKTIQTSKSFKEDTDYTNDLAATTQTKRHRLLPYECERGVCTPGQCDPYECLERIKRRERNYGTSTGRRMRDRYVDGPGVGRRRDAAQQLRLYEGMPDSTFSQGEYATAYGPAVPRSLQTGSLGSYPPGPQAVRIGSSFSFNIEFFKDKPSAMQEIQLVSGMGPGLGPIIGPGQGIGQGPGLGPERGPGLGPGQGPRLSPGLRPESEYRDFGRSKSRMKGVGARDGYEVINRPSQIRPKICSKICNTEGGIMRDENEDTGRPTQKNARISTRGNLVNAENGSMRDESEGISQPSQVRTKICSRMCNTEGGTIENENEDTGRPTQKNAKIRARLGLMLNPEGGMMRDENEGIKLTKITRPTQKSAKVCTRGDVCDAATRSQCSKACQNCARLRYKSTGMGPFFKRCFCTLKLQKQFDDTMEGNGDVSGKSDTRDMKTATKRFRPLLPYECEPGVCTPSQCDPIVCLERIKQRNKAKKIGTDSYTPYQKSVYSGRYPYGAGPQCARGCQADTTPQGRDEYLQAFDNTVEEPRFTNVLGGPQGFRYGSSDQPGGRLGSSDQQGVRFGSNFKFNIEFFKERVPPDFSKVQAETCEVIPTNYQTLYVKPQKDVKQIYVNDKCYSTANTQSEGIRLENKATGVMNTLRRCFCTLNLQRAATEPSKNKIVNVMAIDDNRGPFRNHSQNNFNKGPFGESSIVYKVNNIHANIHKKRQKRGEIQVLHPYLPRKYHKSKSKTLLSNKKMRKIPNNRFRQTPNVWPASPTIGKRGRRPTAKRSKHSANVGSPKRFNTKDKSSSLKSSGLWAVVGFCKQIFSKHTKDSKLFANLKNENAQIDHSKTSKFKSSPTSIIHDEKSKMNRHTKLSLMVPNKKRSKKNIDILSENINVNKKNKSISKASSKRKCKREATDSQPRRGFFVNQEIICAYCEINNEKDTPTLDNKVGPSEKEGYGCDCTSMCKCEKCFGDWRTHLAMQREARRAQYTPTVFGRCMNACNTLLKKKAPFLKPREKPPLQQDVCARCCKNIDHMDPMADCKGIVPLAPKPSVRGAPVDGYTDICNCISPCVCENCQRNARVDEIYERPQPEKYLLITNDNYITKITEACVCEKENKNGNENKIENKIVNENVNYKKPTGGRVSDSCSCRMPCTCRKPRAYFKFASGPYAKRKSKPSVAKTPCPTAAIAKTKQVVNKSQNEKKDIKKTFLAGLNKILPNKLKNLIKSKLDKSNKDPNDSPPRSELATKPCSACFKSKTGTARAGFQRSRPKDYQMYFDEAVDSNPKKVAFDIKNKFRAKSDKFPCPCLKSRGNLSKIPHQTIGTEAGFSKQSKDCKVDVPETAKLYKTGKRKKIIGENRIQTSITERRKDLLNICKIPGTCQKSNAKSTRTQLARAAHRTTATDTCSRVSETSSYANKKQGGQKSIHKHRSDLFTSKTRGLKPFTTENALELSCGDFPLPHKFLVVSEAPQTGSLDSKKMKKAERKKQELEKMQQGRENQKQKCDFLPQPVKKSKRGDVKAVLCDDQAQDDEQVMNDNIGHETRKVDAKKQSRKLWDFRKQNRDRVITKDQTSSKISKIPSTCQKSNAKSKFDSYSRISETSSYAKNAVVSHVQILDRKNKKQDGQKSTHKRYSDMFTSKTPGAKQFTNENAIELSCGDYPLAQKFLLVREAPQTGLSNSPDNICDETDFDVKNHKPKKKMQKTETKKQEIKKEQQGRENKQQKCESLPPLKKKKKVQKSKHGGVKTVLCDDGVFPQKYLLSQGDDHDEKVIGDDNIGHETLVDAKKQSRKLMKRNSRKKTKDQTTQMLKNPDDLCSCKLPCSCQTKPGKVYTSELPCNDVVPQKYMFLSDAPYNVQFQDARETQKREKKMQKLLKKQQKQQELERIRQEREQERELAREAQRERREAENMLKDMKKRKPPGDLCSCQLPCTCQTTPDKVYAHEMPCNDILPQKYVFLSDDRHKVNFIDNTEIQKREKKRQKLVMKQRKQEELERMKQEREAEREAQRERREIEKNQRKEMQEMQRRKPRGDLCSCKVPCECNNTRDKVYVNQLPCNDIVPQKYLFLSDDGQHVQFYDSIEAEKQEKKRQKLLKKQQKQQELERIRQEREQEREAAREAAREAQRKQQESKKWKKELQKRKHPNDPCSCKLPCTCSRHPESVNAQEFYGDDNSLPQKYLMLSDSSQRSDAKCYENNEQRLEMNKQQNEIQKHQREPNLELTCGDWPAPRKYLLVSDTCENDNVEALKEDKDALEQANMKIFGLKRLKRGRKKKNPETVCKNERKPDSITQIYQRSSGLSAIISHDQMDVAELACNDFPSPQKYLILSEMSKTRVAKARRGTSRNLTARLPRAYRHEAREGIPESMRDDQCECSEAGKMYAKRSNQMNTFVDFSMNTDFVRSKADCKILIERDGIKLTKDKKKEKRDSKKLKQNKIRIHKKRSELCTCKTPRACQNIAINTSGTFCGDSPVPRKYVQMQDEQIETFKSSRATRSKECQKYQYQTTAVQMSDNIQENQNIKPRRRKHRSVLCTCKLPNPRDNKVSEFSAGDRPKSQTPPFIQDDQCADPPIIKGSRECASAICQFDSPVDGKSKKKKEKISKGKKSKKDKVEQTPKYREDLCVCPFPCPCAKCPKTADVTEFSFDDWPSPRRCLFIDSNNQDKNSAGVSTHPYTTGAKLELYPGQAINIKSEKTPGKRNFAKLLRKTEKENPTKLKDQYKEPQTAIVAAGEAKQTARAETGRVIETTNTANMPKESENVAKAGKVKQTTNAKMPENQKKKVKQTTNAKMSENQKKIKKIKRNKRVVGMDNETQTEMDTVGDLRRGTSKFRNISNNASNMSKSMGKRIKGFGDISKKNNDPPCICGVPECKKEMNKMREMKRKQKPIPPEKKCLCGVPTCAKKRKRFKAMMLKKDKNPTASESAKTKSKSAKTTKKAKGSESDSESKSKRSKKSKLGSDSEVDERKIKKTKKTKISEKGKETEYKTNKFKTRKKSKGASESVSDIENAKKKSKKSKRKAEPETTSKSKKLSDQSKSGSKSKETKAKSEPVKKPKKPPPISECTCARKRDPNLVCTCASEIDKAKEAKEKAKVKALAKGKPKPKKKKDIPKKKKDLQQSLKEKEQKAKKLEKSKQQKLQKRKKKLNIKPKPNAIQRCVKAINRKCEQRRRRNARRRVMRKGCKAIKSGGKAVSRHMDSAMAALASTAAMKSITSTLEQHYVSNFIIHARDPKKRFSPKKKVVKDPVDFECSPFMASLRRRPWLSVYYMCPWFYPHCISCLNVWKQFTDVVLFLLAVGVWSPCILAMEVVRALVCCTFCTG